MMATIALLRLACQNELNRLLYHDSLPQFLHITKNIMYLLDHLCQLHQTQRLLNHYAKNQLQRFLLNLLADRIFHLHPMIVNKSYLTVTVVLQHIIHMYTLQAYTPCPCSFSVLNLDCQFCLPCTVTSINIKHACTQLYIYCKSH